MPRPRTTALLEPSVRLRGDAADRHREATVSVEGRLVRAHVACRTMDEAIDLLAARVRRGVRALADRRRDDARRAASCWHDDEPAYRPARRPRPVADRRLARRKSLAIGRMSPAQAAFEMRLLDHDLHLFADDATGADRLIHRTADGGLALVSADTGADTGPGAPAGPPVVPAIPMDLSDALAVLDATEAPFVAFIDPVRRRLMVAYRRYDGHYGLLGPADRS